MNKVKSSAAEKSSVVERFLVTGSTTTPSDLPAAVAAFFETIADRSWENDAPQGFSPTGPCQNCIPQTTGNTCVDCGLIYPE